MEKEPRIVPKDPEILKKPFDKGVHPYTMMFLFLAYEQKAYAFFKDDLQRILFDQYFTGNLTIEGQKNIKGRINLEKELRDGFEILRSRTTPEINDFFTELLLPYFKISDIPFVDKSEIELKKVRYANLSISNKGKKLTDEHKRKISVSNQGKKQPPEAVEKSRKANLGRKHGPAQLKRMSEITTNMWADEEFKKAMKIKLIERWSDKTFKETQSQNRRGRKLTDEHKQNISKAKKGKKHSEEAKRKMKEAALRRNAIKRKLKEKI